MEVAEKTCRICGKTSLKNKKSCCEACKEFFRRSVAERKVYKCHFGGICTIAKCRKCRFDKCLLMGLDPRRVLVQHRPELDRQYFALIDRKLAALKENCPTTSSALCPKSEPGDFGQPNLAEESQNQSPVDATWGAVVQVFHEDNFQIDAPLHDQKLFETSHTLKVLGLFEAQSTQLFNYRDLRFATGFLEQFCSLGELLECCGSLSVHADADKVMSPLAVLPSDWANNPAHEELVQDYTVQLVKLEFMATIELIRRMPFFRLLARADQICLINYVGSPLNKLNLAYYTSKLAVPFATRASGFSYYLVFQQGFGDPIIKSLFDRLFVTMVHKIRQLQLDSAEFLLVRAITVMHSATTGLSMNGQQLIQEEAERTVGMLMHYLQSRHGHFGAVKRYVELLSLVECVFHNAQKNRECIAYMEALRQEKFGWLRSRMPRAFVQMHWNGCEFEK